MNINEMIEKLETIRDEMEGMDLDLEQSMGIYLVNCDTDRNKRYYNMYFLDTLIVTDVEEDDPDERKLYLMVQIAR